MRPDTFLIKTQEIKFVTLYYNNCKNISTRNETRHVSYKDTRNQLFDPFLKIITKILALARNETRHVSYKDTRSQLFDPLLK